ncbi:PEP-CTERM sorting domain-containing protein [Alkalimarinus alittae]|uniref:PEP-CTERM sorting domain-containing protein n=1 Tax=Alkalimarinus alittae TaxID=2961619 RepID=A0ABY6N761_9ALTE|nr:PEP-CTERM sorting domain-containing protein [Alkalimarinus alittae]UZE97958.1 PEP-CTERM sorting domain-containing protein [Alkalimarinus alittae]
MKRLLLAAAITAASAATNAAVVANVFTGTDAEVLAYSAQYQSYFNSGATIEDFETGFTTVTGGLDNSGVSVNTSVGKFRSANTTDGTLGQYGKTLALADENTTIFTGRKNGTVGGKNYLDSNDSTRVVWDLELDPIGSFSDVGFLLSDVGDVSAFLDIKFKDGTSTTLDLLGDAADGNLQYVTAHFDPSVTYAQVVFKNKLADGSWSTNDGWGIDDIIVGKVPEPSSVALLGLGLLGAGMARRKKQA